MRFADHFELELSQYELDFVDIPLETDIALFIDPYAIAVRDDPWFVDASNDVVDFFQLVLDSIRAGREQDGLALLNRLPEPNQTHLGLSRGRPSGRSIGREQASDLFDRLRNSHAVTTGFLNDLADCELVIPGIGPDKISDITTNIIKSRLLEYTYQQCDALDIPLTNLPQRYWDPAARTWRNDFVPLPLVTFENRSEAIILVPKVIARLGLAFDAYDYYNRYVLEFLRAEELSAGGSLVRLLKNGRRVVYKKDVEEENPFSKDFLFRFSVEHEEVLEAYKRAVEPGVLISNEEIETVHPQPSDEFDFRELCDDLAAIPPGTATATTYHRKILGIVEALFHPHLRRFVKEQEVDQGRRRIDIVSRNTADQGFFSWLNTNLHIHCPFVMMECKNYTTDPGNPELDQLNGRLSQQRGMFGILICRTVHDKERMTARCRDYITNQGHHILVLDDDDICDLLQLMQAGGYEAVSERLDELLATILLR